MTIQLGVGLYCLFHLNNLLNDVWDWLTISNVVQTCHHYNFQPFWMLQVLHEKSSCEVPKPTTNNRLYLEVVLHLQLAVGPHIKQGTGGQDDLPGWWVGCGLLCLAHDAVEFLASLVHLGKLSYCLGTYMVVVDGATTVTTELAQGVPVLALLLGVPDLLLPDQVRVVHRVGVSDLSWVLAMLHAVGMGSELGSSGLEQLAAASYHISGWERLYRRSCMPKSVLTVAICQHILTGIHPRSINWNYPQVPPSQIPHRNDPESIPIP